MFDLLVFPTARASRPAPSAAAYGGPERRNTGSMVWRWLALTLDEIDYGMLLVADETRVVHANHVARSEMDRDHPLQLVGSDLRVRHARDLALLRDALADAARHGKRRLLAIGDAPQRVSVAVVPLKEVGPDGCPAALLMFGKRRVCEELSVQGFARCHGLTPAETQVLSAVCSGATPSEVARCQGVALSTVRTQISSIRAKTGAESIRALVRQVAVLPPLVSALRGNGFVAMEGANDARQLRA